MAGSWGLPVANRRSGSRALVGAGHESPDPRRTVVGWGLVGRVGWRSAARGRAASREVDGGLWSVRGPQPELLVPGVRGGIFADHSPDDPGPIDGFFYLGAATPIDDLRLGLWRYHAGIDAYAFLGPSGWPFGPGIPDPCQRTVTVGPTVLFCGTQAIWVSDGTVEGTLPITPAGDPGWTGWPIALTRTGPGRAFFTAFKASGPEAWTTDGTPAGTMPVGRAAGSERGYLVGEAGVAWEGRTWASESLLGGIFVARPDGSAVERIDDTGRPLLVTDFGIVARRDAAFGSQCPAAIGCEPWVWREESDWSLLADLAPGPESSSTFGWTIDATNQVLFGASTPREGFELWVTRGAPGTTQMQIDLAPGPENGLTPWSHIIPLADGGAVVSRTASDPEERRAIGPALPHAVSRERLLSLAGDWLRCGPLGH